MTSPSHPLKCPACDGLLSTHQVDAGLTVEVCRQGCGGLWFDGGTIGAVEQADEAAGVALLSAAENTASTPDVKRRCPRCPDLFMLKRPYGPLQPVRIDECPGCAGIWLDAGEWEAIRQAFVDDHARQQAATAYRQAMAAGVRNIGARQAAKTRSFHATARFLGHLWHDYNLLHFRGRDWPPWRGALRD